ncbi:MAG TPA: DUF6763 family protein [Gammaproteobacteria bacterium]|nr:DUF6763 family protein [Gammaproteobacteria bacterium]
MVTRTEPAVGAWYRNRETDARFEVVAVDEHARTVEVQHYDGDLEEYDFGAWSRLDLEELVPPEDWSGPLDLGERDDLEYGEEPGAEEPPEESVERLRGEWREGGSESGDNE